MRKIYLKPARALALGCILAASSLSLTATLPGIAIMYADGSVHSHSFTDLTRLEIGSDEVVAVHSSGAATHKMADIDRIIIGTEVASTPKLPAEAAFALWPTAVSEAFNLLAAEDCRVMVYDLNGRLVAGPFAAEKDNTLSVDISNLSPDWYIVTAGNHSVKIIKN